MPYHFVTDQRDYTDYASGRVLYNSPGAPVLPVRLASEIFLRCMNVRTKWGLTTPVVLFDPCCGSAYHLTALAYLHWEVIAQIVASDIDDRVLAVAARNLSLLTAAGLERREFELGEMLRRYARPSHAEALESVQRLRSHRVKQMHNRPISTLTFRADSTNPAGLSAHLGNCMPDLVMTDVPYGQHTTWQGMNASDANQSPLWWLLETLRPLLGTNAIVAIVADKRQTVKHAEYQRVERFQLGKREIVLLHPHER